MTPINIEPVSPYKTHFGQEMKAETQFLKDWSAMSHLVANESSTSDPFLMFFQSCLIFFLMLFFSVIFN